MQKRERRPSDGRDAAATDEAQAGRPRPGRRLLARSIATVSGPTSVRAPARSSQTTVLARLLRNADRSGDARPIA